MTAYYKEGKEAFNNMLDYDDNPYPEGSMPNSEWADGWVDAAREEDEE